MKSLFEQLGGTYRQEGDYLIPNLTLPTEKEDKPIGICGLSVNTKDFSIPIF